MKKTKGFDFKQFQIDAGYSGMPVSTDGVLLGAWAEIEQAATLLDIGTGTGLLALMCAQRNHGARIDAIEVDQHAIDAATANFANSPWSKRLTLIAEDVLQHDFSHQYDAIICNPPYFNTGEQARNHSRATARHTDCLSHSALLERCWTLLSNVGHASFILPKVEGDSFIELAQSRGWQLQRLFQVRPSTSKQVNRLLIQLGKQPKLFVSRELSIRDQASYSDDFINLTKDFYLKM